jgi:hypothetical protein
MATREITEASTPTRTRPGVMALALVLAVITVSLGLSLIASRSTVTQLNRETARLHTELTTSRSALSALELHLMAARGMPEGPFERVRYLVVAKTAEIATRRQTRSGT